MAQTIPTYVINLDRRPDRMERIGTHLAARGVSFLRQPACDAQTAPEAEIAAITRDDGPLGPLSLGGRACTVSHTLVWRAIVDGPAEHAMVLEDDIHLSQDIAALLASDSWIPLGCNMVKLEKYNRGVSKLLLGDAIGHTPSGRALRPMHSRHMGSGAYVISREGARQALSHLGRYKVPVDHFLFNNTLSPIRRALAPAIVVPAMATQRMIAYDSDITPPGQTPAGLKPRNKRLQSLRRGLIEVNDAPRQIWQWATGQARIVPVAYAEDPPLP